MLNLEKEFLEIQYILRQHTQSALVISGIKFIFVNTFQK